MRIKKLVDIAMLLSLSIVLSILESMIPFLSGTIPGVKIGLANIIVLYVLYKYSFKDALYLTIARVFLVGMLRTGLFSITFFFSLSGAILSIIMMMLVKKTKLSIIGVSIVGSVSHSIGQIVFAIFLFKQMGIIYYLPFILLFSIPTGIIVGYISKTLISVK
jgi:heptaprenyl diphosphate synthase